MIVVDRSALLAILFAEPEQQAFEVAIAVYEWCVISAVNAHETAIVLGARLGTGGAAHLWRLLADFEIWVVPFDEA